MSSADIAILQGQVAQLGSDLASLSSSVNQFWQYANFYVLFIMGAGFSMLECGCVRYKSHARKNILLKNMWDTTITGIIFYFLTWALGFGQGWNGFIGVDDFLINDTENYANWLFQWVFMNSTITIVSGAMAERIHVVGYAIYVTWASLIVYPVISHWMWGPGGWLQTEVGQYGALDFAGGIVVHSQGGSMAFIGSLIIGPRIGRFTGVFDDCDVTASSAPDQVLGLWLLWMSWYPFNMGSTLAITDGWSILAGHIGVSMTICACVCGCCSAIFGAILRNGQLEVGDTVNGAIAGLVAITPACGYCPIWAAFPIGIIAAIIWIGLSKLWQFCRIDDPLDAAPIHWGCGAWGAIAIGLFGGRDEISFVKGVPFEEMKQWGGFLGGGGTLLGVQILAVVVCSLYAMAMATIVFLSLKFVGLLRVSESVEMSGLSSANSKAERDE